MSTRHLRNVPLKLFRSFLIDKGLKCNRKKGGHEHYSRKNLRRPITIQSHRSCARIYNQKRFKTVGINKKGNGAKNSW